MKNLTRENQISKKILFNCRFFFHPNTLFILLALKSTAVSSCQLAIFNSKLQTQTEIPHPIETSTELCKSEVPQKYLSFANTQGISLLLAQHIYDKIMEFKNPRDTVTGFATGLERMPVVRKASKLIGIDQKSYFYIEIDLRNLGGLNSVLKSHSEANKLFKKMASTTQEELLSLLGTQGELCAFRHGGDEFSYVINLKNSSAHNHLLEIERKLTQAQSRISVLIQNWQIKDPLSNALTTVDLSSISHPKNCISEATLEALRATPEQKALADRLCAPFRGTGFYFGVSPIPPTPAELLTEEGIDCWLAENVIKTADAAMSKQKLKAMESSAQSFSHTLKIQALGDEKINKMAREMVQSESEGPDYLLAPLAAPYGAESCPLH